MGLPMIGGGVGWPTYYLKVINTAGVLSYGIKKTDGTTAATAYTDALMTWINITTADLDFKEGGPLECTLNQKHAGSKFTAFWRKWGKPRTAAASNAKEFNRLDGVKQSSATSSSTTDLLLTLAVGDVDEDDSTKRELIPIIHSLAPDLKSKWDSENFRDIPLKLVSVSELVADLTIPVELLPPAWFDHDTAPDPVLLKTDTHGKPNWGYDFLYSLNVT